LRLRAQVPRRGRQRLLPEAARLRPRRRLPPDRPARRDHHRHLARRAHPRGPPPPGGAPDEAVDLSRPEREAMSVEPPYEELFTRNIGFVDENEQHLLRRSRIAVLGVGGMGGVVAQVLARAGVGALSILDKDAFEPSNNNRQVYSNAGTWGQPKVD